MVEIERFCWSDTAFHCTGTDPIIILDVSLQVCMCEFYLEWVSLNVADFAIGIALKSLRQAKICILISPNLPCFF